MDPGCRRDSRPLRLAERSTARADPVARCASDRNSALVKLPEPAGMGARGRSAGWRALDGIPAGRPRLLQRRPSRPLARAAVSPRWRPRNRFALLQRWLPLAGDDRRTGAVAERQAGYTHG